MSYHNPQRASFVVLLTAIASLALGQTLLAQRQTRTPPQGTRKVLIFKSKGVSRTSEDDVSSAPPNLSVALKNEMLKELNLTRGPGSVYIKLTARNNYVLGKGFLFFKNPTAVKGDADNAFWALPDNEKEDFVEINLKSDAAGRRYLIDCAVKQVGIISPFKIWAGGNELLQTIESAGVQGQHLVFLLDATDDGWHKFRISCGRGWFFYSCEVTNL